MQGIVLRERELGRRILYILRAGVARRELREPHGDFLTVMAPALRAHPIPTE
ncbi:hypothetical protein [Streptomyces luteoverticillatus]|uniref:hypothetical protein n=1 Tax=Streptomyces luteoverticillatus TaxID=66425 RepID=UPI0013E049FD|nr:hypothetical protein [Streptomyces luteoverticillatus]